MARLRKDGQPDRRAGRFMPPVNRTHGHASGTKSPEYKSWRAMKARCLNSKDPAYHRYGGRGIGVEDRWLVFANFLADMGPRPPGTSLEREKNNDGYCATNCRWATRLEQARNTRANNIIVACGKSQTISQWARDLDCDPGTIRYRIRRGMTPEQAVTTAIDMRKAYRHA